MGYANDEPIKTLKDDSMPVAKQVMGFAEYLRKCDTPLTISVQGKWGSGKTSFFQLTKEFILGRKWVPKM